MLKPLAAGVKPWIYRTARLFLRWDAQNRFRKELDRFSDEELDLALANAGMSRSDLFSVAKGNARHRQRLGRMMQHFGVDPQRAAEYHWRDLKYAERVCSHCTNAKKCHRWLNWGVMNDAPRTFCPNAGIFDAIACGSPQGGS